MSLLITYESEETRRIDNNRTTTSTTFRVGKNNKMFGEDAVEENTRIYNKKMGQKKGKMMQKAIDHMAYSFAAMNTTMERQNDFFYHQERRGQNMFHNLSLTQDDYGRGNYSGEGRRQEQHKIERSPEQSKLVLEVQNGTLHKTKYAEGKPVNSNTVEPPEGNTTPGHDDHGDEDDDEGGMTTLRDLSGVSESPVAGAAGGVQTHQVGNS